MTDSQGKVIWLGRYDAWGGLHYDRHLAQQNQGHQPFRLQNQYLDQETGLHYNFLRYYEPITGRFITQDPIGLAGGNNLYRFEGTVQNQIDPLGLFAQIGYSAYVIWGMLFGTAAYVGVLGTIEAMESSESSNTTISDVTKKCDKKQCPPCKTVSGKIVPLKTLAYRPLDIIPDDKMEHGVYGSHHNIFEANQNPKNCQCFWSKQKYVLKPEQLSPNMMPIEDFLN